MKIKLALCWLVAIVITVAGCATSKNGRVAKAEVEEFVLPEQFDAASPPFILSKLEFGKIREAETMTFTAAVAPYLKALEKQGRSPIRVREGLLFTVNGKWFLRRLLLSEGPTPPPPPSGEVIIDYFGDSGWFIARMPR